MSGPTQVLPSWLTLSTTVITQPDGSVSTSSATLQLPLTYYGPSIPLGTDGSWTWGGLTPPSSATTAPPTASSFSSSSTALLTSSVPATSLALSTSSYTSTPLTSASSPSSSSSSVSPSASSVTTSHSTHLSRSAIVGAAVGGALGFILLLIVVFTFWCLHRRRVRSAADPSTQGSSSFWNRQTTLLSRVGSRRQTPIWTGWEVLDPDPDEAVNDEAARSPGEGSPRGSGEEDDPFLTRRSVASGPDEMTQAKTGTVALVSLPAAAAVPGGASPTRSEPRAGGPILSREALLRMDKEDALPEVRVIEASPHATPLMPPPPLGRGLRSAHNPSIRSIASNVTAGSAQNRSVASEPSMGSFSDPQEHESAELLTARRVNVGDLRQARSTELPRLGSEEAGSSALDRLTNIGRLSWFRRMSFLGAGAVAAHGPRSPSTPPDTYTRTPPRSHSRSHSRPVSWAPLPTHDPTGAELSLGRARHDSPSLGHSIETDERPISTLSTKSGNTLYLDARSTLGSSEVDLASVGTGSANAPPPVPPIPPVSEQRQPSSPLAREIRRSDNSGAYPGKPPSYDVIALSSGSPPEPVDILDIPAPPPAEPFAAARHDFPPGLVPLPSPRVWRDSQPSSPTSGSSAGIQIDVLEEEPPSARAGWRSLQGSGEENRRTTFGIPVVVHARDAQNSEQGSLYSMRSHLSPRSRLSPSGSAPASSLHTVSHSGSGSSSRPTFHSQGRAAGSGVSLSHSNSVSSDERRPHRRAAAGEVGSPPLSAVWPGRNYVAQNHPPILPQGPTPPPLAYPSPLFGRPAVSDTVTSSGTSRTTRTEDTNTSSVTTAMTDPITGAVIHSVRLPWRGGDSAWRDSAHEDDPGW
ncbi:predicted protein [Sparassis crispa]|uniref:Uncharacterized protein n=1 Tax=Sparassis crispa TaxID=139825 RepID=A0A401H215_9APHY|nr:predicted protein [Sparassis crispa]GBE88432.1 predicted protein [Sparassis crispa]